jgi:ADP-ribose pyrophosphatase
MTAPVRGVRPDPAFRLIESDLKFQGRIVGVSVDHIRLPGGHETRYEVLHLPSAVAVVPLLEEAGRTEVVLVEQLRTSLGGYIHEVPAGILEPDEDPAACAARELEEETGFRASRITPLTEIFPIPGTSAHQMHFYLAEGLRPGEQRLEDAECLTVVRFPLEDVVRWILDPASAPPGKDGRPIALVDAKSHVGILHVALRRREGALAAPGSP